MKKSLLVIKIVCIISMFSPTVLAYDYVNPNNQSAVESARSDIYSLKEMYEELAGLDDESDGIDYENANNDSYWWPIGSKETTTSDGKTFATGDPEATTITSTFGYRGAVIDSSGKQISGNANHGAIDIANTSGVNVTNVIAAKDGTVVFPTAADNTSCVQGDNGCNGGYGNYIVIQHNDGNYTLYAHLATDSITVKAGDVVSQGQVIGKIGSTGNSTGPHLHFEVRNGENTSSARVDPLEYVDPDNPRPSASQLTGSAIELATKLIIEREGIGCLGQLSEEGDNYVACVGSDGVTTIGPGIVWESNKSEFKKYGYTNVSSGTRVPKSIVNKIKEEVVQYHLNIVYNSLAEAGIDNLKDYQIAVLTSRSYNGGECWVHYCSDSYADFISAYQKYHGTYTKDEATKSTKGLWSDAMSMPIKSKGETAVGLQKRRVWEWLIFTTGDIPDYDSININNYVWN